MFSLKRVFLLTLFAAASLLGTFLFGAYFNVVSAKTADFIGLRDHSNPRLHFLLPATGTNLNLCKLILSASVTGYPEPIFVGWDGHGMFDGTKSHLFKISETLAYLRTLPDSADNDLVLVLDAYDIWMQFRPDVLISRYYSVLEKNNQRLRDEGIFRKFHRGSDVRQTIIFGPDKVCWPQATKDPAFWAVPSSPMATNAFGPDTDSEMFSNRPMYLNSGTIMGPAKDMRDLFAATMDQVSRKFDPDSANPTSDQYFFAEVFGDQEVERMRLRDGGINTSEGAFVPQIPQDRRTEFHITLDYETEIFQTAGAYDHHLTWMSFNHSTPISEQQRGQQTMRIDQWTLPEDILASPGPFADVDHSSELPRSNGWADVMLGTNVITQKPFALFHMTGDKSVRERWWSRMWFQPYARQLLQAAMLQRSSESDPDKFAVINGVSWRGARPSQASGPKPIHDNGLVSNIGGGWSDRGEYQRWETLCQAHEEELLH